MKKIAIFGAGSIGCYVGGAWALSNCDVTFIGRERIKKEIATHGLCLSDFTDWSSALSAQDIRFDPNPGALEDADVIAVCVKSNTTEEAAAAIRTHAKEDALVISFQNGVSNADRLSDLLETQTVLAGMVPFNVAYLGNGRWHKGTSGDLIVENNNRIVALADQLYDGPAPILLKENMPAIMWGKLLLNLNNPLNALSGTTLLAQLSDRDFRRVLALSIRETLNILKIAKIEPAKVGPMPPNWLPAFLKMPDFIFNTIGLRLQKIDDQARSSMNDDLTLGRKTEIDYLSGEVVQLAAQTNENAPVNTAIVSLIREAERGGRRHWSGTKLLSYIRSVI